MSTITATRAPRPQHKPRHKPARSIRLCVAPSPINAGVVRISIGHKTQDYFPNEVEGVAFGRGFLVEKIGHEESYHVNIDHDTGRANARATSRIPIVNTATAWRRWSPPVASKPRQPDRGS